jgi:4-amino-4-deoxy-L-arabinose transferase-like glycosyltransferase
MRWKLLFLVSVITALIASATWFLLIFLFFSGSFAIPSLDARWWPLSLILPFLLVILGGFFVYRHTSRRRKTQAVITILAVLTLTALVCFTVTVLLRNRTITSLPSPVQRSSAPAQSLSAPASENQSQTECAHPTRRLTPGHLDGYHRDLPNGQRLCPSVSS